MVLGGSFQLRNTSRDRNVKANFSVVDGPALLAKIAALPVSSWNYKAQPSSVRRLGLMQDFPAAFGLGEDEKHNSTDFQSGKRGVLPRAQSKGQAVRTRAFYSKGFLSPGAETKNNAA